MSGLGFTGTKDGMTRAQYKVASVHLMQRWGELHHGDCVGADKQAHLSVIGTCTRVVIHPADVPPHLRAGCIGHEVRDPKPPLERNRDIVDETACLLAAPDGPERLRSGTWATVRYALKTGKPVTIIMPDGEEILR